MIGDHQETWETILKGHNIISVKKHLSRWNHQEIWIILKNTWKEHTGLMGDRKNKTKIELQLYIKEIIPVSYIDWIFNMIMEKKLFLKLRKDMAIQIHKEYNIKI